MVLTFDDGPGNRLTPEIMELLEKNNVKASFFLLGRNIVGREAIVRQLTERGHDICSHGYDHVHHWKVHPFRVLSDIRRGWRAIDGALGAERGKYPFRPPNGKLNIISLLYLLCCRVPIIYWTHDSGDTFRVKPDVNQLQRSVKEAGAMVALVHDFDRRDDSRDDLVLEFVHSALGLADEKNMRVLTISQLLNRCKRGT